MKKQVVLGALLSLLLMGTTAAYTDVPDSHWAKAQIERLSEENIIQGFPDGTFAPEGALSRAEFLALLARCAMPDAIKEQENPAFWWEPYYDAAASTEIGVSRLEGELQWFKDKMENAMDRPITRFEAAVLLDLAYMDTYGFAGAEIEFSDIEKTDGYYAGLTQYAVRAVKRGVLTGYSDGSFRGHEKLTRAEAATIFVRLQAHQREGEKMIVANGTIMITEARVGNTLSYQSIDMITGEVLSAVTVTGIDKEYYYFTQSVRDNYFWGPAGLFRYEANGTILQLAERVDKMVVEEGGIFITQTIDGETVTFRSFDKSSGTLVDTLSVPIIFPIGEIGDFSVINSNSKYFWGYTGLFTFDNTGTMQQLIFEPVVDYSYDIEEGRFVIVTQPADEEPHFYSLGAVYWANGTQIVSISDVGGERAVLFENDEFIIIGVSSVGGIVTFESIYEFYGHTDSNRLTYRLENGKLRVLSSTHQGWDAQSIANAQQKLDELGIGINSK